jgi:ABC-type glycerol-3-phosphate transport system permease component
MKSKTVYLFLCVLGFVAPYAAFLPWLAEHGPNGRLFLQHLAANRISTFFALDVVVSAVVLLCFAAVESSRLRLRGRWIIILATLLVGVSLGLPLFLYLRERGLEQSQFTA